MKAGLVVLVVVITARIIKLRQQRYSVPYWDEWLD